MDRDFRNGYLEIDFTTEPFASAGALLRRSLHLFFSTFPFLAAVTLLVFIPCKLALQFACYVEDVPLDGILSYVLLSISDVLLSALTVPAIVYGLFHYRRTGRTPPLSAAFRWGGRRWLPTLGNRLKVEVIVTLRFALLVVPGILAMVRLIFTDVIVAVEGDRRGDVLDRSRVLTLGHRWPIFFVLVPLTVLDMGAMFLVLDRVQGVTQSRVLFALAESVLAVAGQLGTVAILLMYLGLVQRSIRKLKP
jgi:hypothetical protein